MSSYCGLVDEKIRASEKDLPIKNRPVSINVLNIRIENNHFTCECDKMSWFLGAMTKNFDTDVIANGRGSLDFLRFFKAQKDFFFPK